MDEEAQGYLARLRGVWGSQGLAGVWFGALALTVYRRMHVFERPLSDPIPLNGPGVEAEIRELTAADEAAYFALRPGDAGGFLERLERGHRGWGAWCQGGLRHVCWAAFREARIDYLACSFPLADDEAYTYGLFTHPQWRGLGLSFARMTLCMEALKGRGCQRVLSAVLPENRLVRSPLMEAGYRRIGLLGCLGRGRRRHFFYRSLPGCRPPAGFMGPRGVSSAPPNENHRP